MLDLEESFSMISNPNVTPEQLALVQLIEGRMEELGLPKNHAFGQGDLTRAFVDLGHVMVTVCGKKHSALFFPERKFSMVYKEWIKP